MTQMGLEYAKYKETARHNVQDEGIRTTGNTISQQDANTRQYTASFEPQRVAATTEQAKASTAQSVASLSQADTAAGKLALDQAYRERETQAKEGTTAAQLEQAASSASQAESAAIKADAERLKNLFSFLEPTDATYRTQLELGDPQWKASIGALNSFLDRWILPTATSVVKAKAAK